MENYLNVFSARGVHLWGQRIGGRISGAQVVDLDDDGQNEVLVGVAGRGQDTGKLLVYGLDGQPLWTADTNGAFNYLGGRSAGMAIESFAVGDLYLQGRSQIVALSLDAQGWYQSRLTVWDSDGTLLASYWHPGHLHKVLIAPQVPGGPPRIVVAGLNNDLRAVFHTTARVATVFMLDPRDVRGEAPPYAGASGHGSQLWYGIIVGDPQEIESLEALDYDHDGQNDISVWTSTGYAYYLDFAGQVLGRGISDGAQGVSRFALLVESRP